MLDGAFTVHNTIFFFHHLREGALYIVQRLEQQQENVTLK